METKISVLIAGFFGTIMSFLFDDVDVAFEIFRWIPGSLSILYIYWQYRQKKKRMKK